MAEKNGAQEKANLQASKQLLDIKITQQEKILDLFIKQGTNQEEIEKRTKRLLNLTNQHAKVQKQLLGLEQDITKEEGKQEKSLFKQVVTASSILAVTQKMKSAVDFISKTQRDTANSMGITLNKAAKINKQIAKELKFGLEVNTNRGEIVETMNEMDALFRTSNGYSAAQAKSLAVTANKLNISRGEAAKLSGMMQLIDGASFESSTATLTLAKNLSDANNIKFGKVMKDIAHSGKDFANFSGMSLKNMIRTAVETRKMGFELNDAMNVANKLLDIEGSIESQMKFNVLTGKQANFDRARALVLEGDMAGALEAVKNEVGDISKLGILERKALEDAVGLRADQLQISNSISDIAATNADNEKAALKAYQEGNTQLAEQLLSKEHATTATEAAANAEENIKLSLASQLAEQNKLKNVMLGIQIIQGTLAAISAVKAVAELTSASALTLGLGMIPILAGIGTGIATMTGAFSSAKPPKMDDGVIGSDGGMVVSGPKGSIQLNKDDSIIAGTNLGGGGGSSEIGKKLDTMIQLLSQQRVLNVSGAQLSEVMALESIPVGMG